jgi:hypothetical protein
MGPNIKMQRSGFENVLKNAKWLPAADLGVQQKPTKCRF